MTKIYNDELNFLEQCLRVNPKSYGTWHQRGWVMDRLNTAAAWARELSLCSTYLDYDERNCKSCAELRLIIIMFLFAIRIRESFDLLVYVIDNCCSMCMHSSLLY